MTTKKKLLSIKGISEAKVDKIKVYCFTYHTMHLIDTVSPHVGSSCQTYCKFLILIMCTGLYHACGIGGRVPNSFGV